MPIANTFNLGAPHVALGSIELAKSGSVTASSVAPAWSGFGLALTTNNRFVPVVVVVPALYAVIDTDAHEVGSPDRQSGIGAVSR